MAYALQSMLRIRAMREDRAATELTAARREVSRAQERLSQRKRDLEEYEATKEARRDRIYEAVIGRAVSMEDLDLAREGVARIDEEGILKADNVVQAEADLQKCRNNAETSRQAFVSASKNRMKITEHRSIWEAEEAAEAERRSEMELEDFTGKKVVDDAELSGN
ncbi:MAG: YscO family type III secretion system apparatus protein [Kiritimatiellae bacterium]|nr:YscO family type III secretion system apparatus protein [Kiritimatiellia bacterium]MBR3823052.1 YscO family type III secretion system apparatus protein [Kiritimatiellia bacterium]MBR3924976.1 YscO family type III secretion system apparatus protein [Kiritimatiellia bacterium]